MESFCTINITFYLGIVFSLDSVSMTLVECERHLDGREVYKGITIQGIHDDTSLVPYLQHLQNFLKVDNRKRRNASSLLFIIKAI